MTPGAFYVFPGDLTRELINTRKILDLPQRSGDIRTLQGSPGDIGRIGMYVLVTKVIH